MKNLPKFCLILDNRNSAIYAEACKETKGISEANSDIKPSTPIKTEQLFNIYLELRAAIESTFEKNKENVQFILVNDLRASIGNTLEYLGMSFIGDPIFPTVNGNKIALKGYEQDERLIEVGYPHLTRISENVKIIVGGFAQEDPTYIFEAIQAEDIRQGDINIIVCPQIFEDKELNIMLEEQLISSAPVGTFFMFPEGIQGTYPPDLKYFTREILRKESKDVERYV